MESYRKEFNLLKNARGIIRSQFPDLGVNKTQELIRLLFEIQKRDNIHSEAIIQDIRSREFSSLKMGLLKRRYPHAYLNNELSRHYLPKIKIDPLSILNLKKDGFYPKKVFVETSATSSSLAKRFRSSFPKAKFKEMKSLKQYLATNKTFKIKDYNRRSETAFIIHENYDFFKACPCTKSAIRCGYHIFNLSFGCIFECTYCYLQKYTNTPGIIFPANIDKFFKNFSSYKKKGMRIGTGEFSDSLMLDHITEYSLPIIDFFQKHPDVRFEFKTKSTNIGNLLKAKHSGNIVVSWSLNPQEIIDENEFFTASLEERLQAARKCAQAGYKLAFHFDPVIYFEGWEKSYKEVIDRLFSAVKPKDIAWISIGTLRFHRAVKQTIEARFPDNKILDGELLPGFDNKLRYPSSLRHKIYGAMQKMLLAHAKKLPIYLCMENLPKKDIKHFLFSSL